MPIISKRNRSEKRRYTYKELVSLVLNNFHSCFKKAKSKEQRLTILKCYSGFVIRKRKKKRLGELRHKFKSLKKKNLLNKKCSVCRKIFKFRYRHHVIQLQHGGINGKKNIKYICGGCHKKIHPWL